jgi:transcriptional regulator of heat shock response
MDYAKTKLVIRVLEENSFKAIKAGGVNHKNILNLFKDICKQLEVNQILAQEIKNDTGSNKALLAITVLVSLLNKYKEDFQAELTNKELKVIDFFISDEGELVLMASTSIIVKTFNHLKSSYQEADVNQDGLVTGNECKTFCQRLWCWR